MSRNIFYVLAIIVVVVLIIAFRGDNMEDERQVAMLSVELAEQNASGVAGTATVTANEAGNAVVTISVSGDSAVPQPAHIHDGVCPNPGAVRYALNAVENGTSETTLDVSWADLAALANVEPLAINVHKSQAELSMYTACGDIDASGTLVGDTEESAMIEVEAQ